MVKLLRGATALDYETATSHGITVQAVSTTGLTLTKTFTISVLNVVEQIATNLVAPAITGTATVGGTLTVTPGTWDDETAVLTYQWERNGVAIGGATAAGYVLAEADEATTITVVETATNDYGAANAESAGVGPIEPQFEPSSLFTSGERGAFYDPADLTTEFTTTAGTVAATVNNPVGLLLSKAHWAGQTLAEMVAAQPELVTNGSFDADTNWTKTGSATISGGTLNFGGTLTQFVEQNCGLVAGKRYFCSWAQAVSTAIVFYLGTNSSGTAKHAVQKNGTGSYTANLECSTGNYVRLASPTSGTGTVDNISIKEILGTQAGQGTSAARPTLKQDGGGRYYLDHDGVDDKVTANFLTALGSDCTVAYATSAGVTILTGQTIGTTYDLPAADWYAMVVIDRALLAGETTDLSAYLNAKAGL